MLRLTNTANYGKHITDVTFSKTSPYTIQNYIYNIHPAERVVEEVAMVGDGPEDTTKYVPPPPPPPEVKYAFQIPGTKNSWNLGAGEFCQFLSEKELIAEEEGDSIFKRYSISEAGLKLVDSLVLPSRKMGSTTICHTLPSGKFYLTQTMEIGDSLRITFYDSALKKMASVIEPHKEADITFIDDDEALILNWRKQSTVLTLQKYSLTKGRLFETIVEMPGETGSWDIGTRPVNDTMFLVYAQMYSSRATWVYALSFDGKIYWKLDIPDYTEDINILAGMKKIVCSFYNVQGVSTIKFYSLLTGEYKNTINMEKELPEFAATTTWPVYLPMRTTSLPGGKWVLTLIDCYAPNDQSKSAYYLLASNGTKTLRTKLRKSKSVTSTDIIPFSSSKLAVTIDDDIYYYSITEGENKKAGTAK